MKPVDKSISVIDAAHWLLPETAECAKAADLQHEFVLELEGSTWGIACDDLGFSEFFKR
ncbi:hypothetical protein [Piscirickettsia litoralis]|uniref:hypothetical protein n=1 Tax=Piscirickettsia litoralis TaxID=1891921 RepID=UPI001F36AC0B|nr:hypothetical protein [Piscirickettsia litoralis]